MISLPKTLSKALLTLSIIAFNFTLVSSQTPVFAQQNPIGVINPPGASLPKANDPNAFVASVVRTLISLLLIVAFVIAVIWMIIAGIQFVTGGGDPKAVSAAWGRIYWGIIGLVVVLGSFAIIVMVEKFFKVNIISQGLKLPRI